MRRVMGCALALLAGACGGTNGGGQGAGGANGDDVGGGQEAGVVGTSLADAAGCTLVTQGSSGLALKATLLVPGGPLDGEVLVDATGTIACAAASCSSAPGYAAA